jgi:phosphatidylserine/phosphatidylglycerophosphate/cardiolipin synthase-like enzyme
LPPPSSIQDESQQALSQFRVSLTAVLFLTSLAPCGADPAPVIHYAPTENLEHVDVALIDSAEHEIDMAAYVLTDWPVMQALTRADKWPAAGHSSRRATRKKTGRPHDGMTREKNRPTAAR